MTIQRDEAGVSDALAERVKALESWAEEAVEHIADTCGNDPDNRRYCDTRCKKAYCPVRSCPVGKT